MRSAERQMHLNRSEPINGDVWSRCLEEDGTDVPPGTSRQGVVLRSQVWGSTGMLVAAQISAGRVWRGPKTGRVFSTSSFPPVFYDCTSHPCLPRLAQKAPNDCVSHVWVFPRTAGVLWKPCPWGHFQLAVWGCQSSAPIHNNSPHAALETLAFFFFSFSFKQKCLMQMRFLFPFPYTGVTERECERTGLIWWS